MSRKRADKGGGVMWYIPGRKRPIAYSTKAISDFIVVIGEGKTIQETYDAIYYMHEAKNILKIYIDKGYGEEQINKHFK